MMTCAPTRPFSIILDSSGNDATGPSTGGSSEAAAKASAKDFLNAVEEDLIIDEVANVEQWTTKVMQVKDRPIILDFYADWSAPCKKLMPILEEKARENKGKFKLVKINIDNCP